LGFRDGLAPMQRRLFAEFGEQVTYTPAKQAARVITAVFRAEGQRLFLETGQEVTTKQPLLDVREEDLAPFRVLPDRDEVLVRGRRWTVQEVFEDDGEGILSLLLTDPKRLG
jgi:hypothetical protein